MALPVEMDTCLLVWTAKTAVADTTGDPDALPDYNPIVGATVQVIGSVPRVVSTDPDPVTVTLGPMLGITNSAGVLTNPADDTEGLRVIATNNPGVNPLNFTYTVTITGAGPQQVFTISAPAGTTLDLSSVIPIQTSLGTVITPLKGDKGDQGPAGATIIPLTQAAYDAIVTPDPDTIYVIVG